MKKWSFILIGIVSASCLNMNDPETQTHYTNLRKKFPAYLVDFFPKKLPNSMISFGSHPPDSLDGRGRANIVLKYSKAEFERLMVGFAANSVYRGKVDSGCFEIVGRYSKEYKSNCEQNFPVSEEAVFESRIIFQSKDLNEKFEFRGGSEVLIMKMGQMQNSNLRYVKGVTVNNESRVVVYWFVIYYV